MKQNTSVIPISAVSATKMFIILSLAAVLYWSSSVATLVEAAPPTDGPHTLTVDTLPILWEAGGHSAGNDSAGQAARVAVDAAGNVAVVLGPSLARDLAVTSYT